MSRSVPPISPPPPTKPTGRKSSKSGRTAATVRLYRVALNLTAEQMQAFYAGQVKYVSVRDDFGRRIQFPASILRPYVDQNGVRGRFEIAVDAHSKLLSLRKV